MFGPSFGRAFPAAFYPVSTGAGNGLLNNLVAYWALDEAAGANDALDKHSNGLTLTQGSSPGSDTGKVYATARTFDGSADYFKRGSDAALQIGNASFAVAIWLYPVSFAALTVPIGRWSVPLSWLLVVNDAAAINIQLSADGTSVSYNQNTTATIGINTWCLLMLAYDYAANAVTLHIDGGAASALEATQPTTAGIYAGSAPFYVGAYAPSVFTFNGRIGPVAFWKNRTFDAAARAALWNGGNGLAYSAFTA